MPTVREKKLNQCVLTEAARKGRTVPRGNGFRERYERCVLRVKCQQKLDRKAKRVNPWAVCHASLGE